MVKVGQIINTRGLKGECKVYVTTDEPESRFKKGNQLMLDGGRDLTITRATPYKDMYYLQFAEIGTIEEAEKLRGSNLWINESDLPELEEDEFYYHQLLGCTVVNEEEEVLGEVSDILETGAHLNLRVKAEDGTNFLLPFVGAFVLDVDVDNKKMVIRDMEGLR